MTLKEKLKMQAAKRHNYEREYNRLKGQAEYIKNNYHMTCYVNSNNSCLEILSNIDGSIIFQSGDSEKVLDWIMYFDELVHELEDIMSGEEPIGKYIEIKEKFVDMVGIGYFNSMIVLINERGFWPT